MGTRYRVEALARRFWCAPLPLLIFPSQTALDPEPGHDVLDQVEVLIIQAAGAWPYLEVAGFKQPTDLREILGGVVEAKVLDFVRLGFAFGVVGGDLLCEPLLQLVLPGSPPID